MADSMAFSDPKDGPSRTRSADHAFPFPIFHPTSRSMNRSDHKGRNASIPKHVDTIEKIQRVVFQNTHFVRYSFFQYWDAAAAAFLLVDNEDDDDDADANCNNMSLRGIFCVTVTTICPRKYTIVDAKAYHLAGECKADDDDLLLLDVPLVRNIDIVGSKDVMNPPINTNLNIPFSITSLIVTIVVIPQA